MPTRGRNLLSATIHNSIHTSIYKKAQALGELRAKEKLLKTEIQTAQADLVADMIVGEITEFDHDGVKATLVRSSTMSIDDEVFEKGLEPEEWKQITRRVIDNKLLSAKAQLGEIPQDLLAEGVQSIPKNPYVNVKIGTQ